jgi:hypothetical protein
MMGLDGVELIMEIEEAFEGSHCEEERRSKLNSGRTEIGSSFLLAMTEAWVWSEAEPC